MFLPEMVEFIQFGMLNDYWTEYFTKPTTDVFDDALDVALDHDVLDVAGQILKRRKCTNPSFDELVGLHFESVQIGGFD
ncbi:hypothetical protein KY284_020061 [Solanum tuberosum]|nr:hypothetical protein KY284_020061 [Solanum tuberosum]